MTAISQDKPTPVAAILFIFASGLLFSFLDSSAKYLVLSGMDAVFVSWCRFAGHAVLVFIMFRGWSNFGIFKTRSLPLQIVRAVFLFGSTIFNFLALRQLQLAETMSIAFFAPMIITALAGPLLGEWAGWRRWMAVLVGLIGVLVITRPGFGSFSLGHLCALASAVSYSIYVLMTRKMSARETTESLIFCSAVAPMLLMAPALPYTISAPPHAWAWVLLASLGIFGGVGHYFIILAYRRATVTALAPYPYLQMVWMILLGWLIFHQLPDLWTVVGAGIIVLSGLYIVRREHVLRVQNRAALLAETEELAKKR
ncbi:DMT family transporter [Corticibacterium sp. UT-5YL-CI-8]|nr:DMT family transporter [Tianweitania sp. UT-5YL-CI-8]